MSIDARLGMMAGAALSLIVPVATWAAPVPAASESAILAGTLDVPMNKSEIVRTDVPIAKAMIGNDDIADVLPVSTNSVYVLGKKAGTTSLTLYDPGGKVISVMDIAVGPDVEALRGQLQKYVPGEPIEARISNDSIVLSGLVNDPGAVGRAMQIARTYAGDKVVNLMSVGSSQQVMLEVRFAEVTRSAGFNVGMNFNAQSRSFQGATGAGTGTDGSGGLGSATGTAISGAFGVFTKTWGIGGTNFSAQLNALESKGLAHTLAQPTLIAISGERASFLAGGEFPVPVPQSTSVGGSSGSSPAITIQFKPFGVSLGFTPTVLGDRTISLIVEPEVSSIDPNASITLGNIAIPGIKTRRAATTLELRDGESFAIAGLLEQDFKTTIQQLPLLGSLPILGSLFRSTDYQKGTTELLIVVTPHLISPIKPGQVRLPTDDTGTPTAIGAILTGKTDPGKPQTTALAPQSAAQPAAAGQPNAGSPAKEHSYAY